MIKRSFIFQQMQGNYQVEEIIDKRVNPTTHKQQYLIKWVGYSLKQTTWEPLIHLVNVKKMVRQFNAKHKSSAKKDKAEKSTNKRQHKNQPIASSEQQDQGPSKILKKEEGQKKRKSKNQKNESNKGKSPKKRNDSSNKKVEEAKSQQKQQQKEDDIYDSPQEKKNTQNEKDTAPSESKEAILKVEILGMCRNKEKQFVYLVKNTSGVYSYKPHDYMIKNLSQELISFYESKIAFPDEEEQEGSN